MNSTEYKAAKASDDLAPSKLGPTLSSLSGTQVSSAPGARSRRSGLNAGELEQVIAELASLPRQELLQRWERLYGNQPPVKISRNLLVRSIAYRMQEDFYGGLSGNTRRRLLKLAEELKSRGDAAITTMPRIKMGTRFVREWRGTLHEVTVTASGFEWQGKVHRSLSEIARLITGTRWNGWTFFGANRKAPGRTGKPAEIAGGLIDSLPADASTRAKDVGIGGGRKPGASASMRVRETHHV